MILEHAHIKLLFKSNGVVSGRCKSGKGVYTVKCDNCDIIFSERYDVFEYRLTCISKEYCGACARPLQASRASLIGIYDENGNLKPNSGRFTKERVDALSPLEYSLYCESRRRASQCLHEKLNSDPLLKEVHYEKVYRNSKIGYVSQGQADIFNIIGLESVEIEKQFNALRLDIACIEHKIVIEYNGDLWHANPRKYKPDDYISAIKMKASEKWNSDFRRRKFLESEGFTVLVIWESDWQINPKRIIDRIISLKHFKEFKDEIQMRFEEYYLNKYSKKTIKMHNTATTKNKYVPFLEKDIFIENGYVYGFYKKESNEVIEN